jgi:malate dehydrogenase (oxaloacetate-decarboxylating)
LRDPNGSLLPAIGDIRRVARAVALAVARQAVDEGLAPKAEHSELKKRIVANQWTPDYR